jgi:hypothetical protein
VPQRPRALRAPAPLAPSTSPRPRRRPRPQDLSRALASSPDAAAVASGARPQLWLPDRGAMGRAGADAWACVPRGAGSLLLQGLPGGGLLVVICDRPRALPDKDRKWAAALAAKLGPRVAA